MPNVTSRNARKLRTWLLGCTIASSVIFLTLALAFVYFDYQRTTESTSEQLETDALAFREYVNNHLRIANLVLDTTYNEIKHYSTQQLQDEAALYTLFQQRLVLTAPLDPNIPAYSLVYVAPDGHIGANSIYPHPRHFDLSNTEYVKHHLQHREQEGVWLGTLYTSQTTGLTIFTLSQRLTDEHARFAGILAITVRTQTLEKYVKQLNLQNEQSIAVIRNDGKPIFRYPPTKTFESTDLSKLPIFSSMQSTPTGSFVAIGPYDKKLRMIGYTHGQQYPFIAYVSVPESAVFGKWKQRSGAIASLTVCMLTTLWLLFFFALSQIKKAEQASYERMQALNDLSAANTQLVQAEKLALLGRAVAVFSHDIAAPIGNSQVIISTLSEHSKTLRHEMQSGALRRSSFQTFLDTVDESADMAQSNLLRASSLLGDFKQTALDQAHSHDRQIELGAWLKHLAHTLSPQLRNTALTLKLEVPKEITLNTAPGPLGQVISNLVSNAIIHAFEQGGTGNISIEARQEQDFVILSITDDGKGMNEQVQRHAFDAFFTTRANSGGTGLGLNIVKELVEGPLKGSLTLRSSPGKGSCFEIRLPNPSSS